MQLYNPGGQGGTYPFSALAIVGAPNGASWNHGIQVFPGAISQSAAVMYIQQFTNATLRENFGGPAMARMFESYWDGKASALEDFNIRSIPGPGTNPSHDELYLFHNGGPAGQRHLLTLDSHKNVDLGYVQSDASFTVLNATPHTGGGDFIVTLPAASGTLAVASGMTSGQVAIAGGAATLKSSLPLVGKDSTIPTAGAISGVGSSVCVDSNDGLTSVGCKPQYTYLGELSNPVGGGYTGSGSAVVYIGQLRNATSLREAVPVVAPKACTINSVRYAVWIDGAKATSSDPFSYRIFDITKGVAFPDTQGYSSATTAKPSVHQPAVTLADPISSGDELVMQITNPRSIGVEPTGMYFTARIYCS